jgi:hypothetical protein
MAREAVFLALFAKLSALAGLQTKGRTLLHWADVAPAAMPALFLAEGRQHAQSDYRMPTKWLWTGRVYIYAGAEPNSGVAAATVLNNLLDGVETAFLPDRDGECTLGGLVSHARINGEVETDEGTLGAIAVAIVPFDINPMV